MRKLAACFFQSEVLVNFEANDTSSVLQLYCARASLFPYCTGKLYQTGNVLWQHLISGADIKKQIMSQSQICWAVV